MMPEWQPGDDPEGPTRKRRLPSLRRVMAYGCITLISCAGLLLLTTFFELSIAAREAARSAQCISNLKQIGLALHNYDSTYGCLPPAYVVDAEGRPLYSWRVVLLAYLERENGWNGGQLTEKFRFDEAWDSPNNRRLHDMRPPNFFCPNQPDRAENAYTSFVAVVGPRTLFPADGKTRRLADIRDDPANTLMLVESGSTAIHWMEPRDLDWDQMSFQINDGSRPCISSVHRFDARSWAHVLTADGGVWTLPDSASPATIRALLMIDDGDTIILPLR
jgi:hypothetical protein